FNREGVVVAAGGYRHIDATTNAEFLVLKNGTRYEGNPGEPDYRIVDFETYAVRIRDRGRAAPVIPVKGMPTMEILASSSPFALTEWHWRLSKTFSMPILMLFALAFSNVEVRRSRLPNMLMAFFIYFVYTNLVGFTVAAMHKETMNPAWGLWWIHGIFLILALYLLFRRNRNRPIIPYLRLTPAH
ncbi:MAG: LptF/LptG family permease, partial [Gammaproteobacteria bacterium]|nr:LptF/LptG family permease [Gammaproteobacteria bacterium]